MAFKVSIEDLATGDVENFMVDQVERTWETGVVRVDPDGQLGDQPPELIETGARRLTIKAFSGAGMKNFEDFSNFTDEAGLADADDGAVALPPPDEQEP